MRYLTFFIGDTAFCTPIDEVLAIQSLPSHVDHEEGPLLLESVQTEVGETALYNLFPILFPEKKKGAGGKMVVFQNADKPFAVAVDRVGEMAEFQKHQRFSLPPLFGEEAKKTFPSALVHPKGFLCLEMNPKALHLAVENVMACMPSSVPVEVAEQNESETAPFDQLLDQVIQGAAPLDGEIEDNFAEAVFGELFGVEEEAATAPDEELAEIFFENATDDATGDEIALEPMLTPDDTTTPPMAIDSAPLAPLEVACQAPESVDEDDLQEESPAQKIETEISNRLTSNRLENVVTRVVERMTRKIMEELMASAKE